MTRVKLALGSHQSHLWQLLPALLLLVAACGNVHTGGRAAPTPASATPYAEPVSEPYPISSIARTSDARLVRVSLSGLPAASATGACHAEVSFELNEQPLSVGIGVSLSSRLLPPFTGCAVAGNRTLLVHLAQPLGRRDVFASGRVTPDGGRFIAVGDSYQQCRPPGCNPMFQPVVPDCAHLRDAIAGSDVPAHFGMAGPCHGRYAAIVVDIGAGACPASDGPNPCAGKRLTRQFWHSDGTSWKLIVAGDAATCASAHHALASFPTALCSQPEWLTALPNG